MRGTAGRSSDECDHDQKDSFPHLLSDMSFRFDPANDRLVGFTYKALGGGEVEFIEYSQAWEVESKKSFNAGGHAVIFH